MDAVRTWVASLSLAEFNFALVASGLLILYFGARAFRALHTQRVLSATPTSWLRSAAQGYTELIGRGIAIPGEPLISPFSGRECLWYRIRAHEIAREAESNGLTDVIRLMAGGWRAKVTPFSWLPARGRCTLDETSTDLFYLDDDTGRCVIDPEGAMITPTLSRSWYGKTPTPDRGPAIGGSVLGNRYRYTEELLLPGDILYAIGDLKTQGGAAYAANQTDEVRSLLSEWKENPADLIARFDVDGNGQICVQEWEQARAAATEMVQARHHNDSVPVAVNLLSRSAEQRYPFVIASESLHAVESGFLRRAIGAFCVSLLGLIVLVGLIQLRS